MRASDFYHKYAYFVLIWFMLTGMFNGIILYFVGIKIKIAVDTLLCTSLFLLRNKSIKFTTKHVLFFSGFLLLTLLSLVYYSNNSHYGFQKLLNNVILTCVSYVNLFIVFFTFDLHPFTKTIARLFKFQIFLTLIFYVFYILFNKQSGILKHSFIQIFILQDWTGRFQGTFAEPGYLGFWLGSAAFISLLVFRKRLGYPLSILLLFILYTACKAKFALIAVPLALVCSSLPIKYFFSKYHVSLFFRFFCICVFSLFWDSFTQNFFEIISHFIPSDGSSTYVTRFSFLLTSIKDICMFPFGHGFGLNYEVFHPILTDIIPRADSVGLETEELRGYFSNPNNMGSKETFSLFATSCGFIGIAVYFLYFKKLLCFHYHKSFFSVALILFCFVESFFTGNVTGDAYFFMLLFIKMALNSNEIRGGAHA